jgi:type II secretory pathway pseudopilin PulG
VGRLPLAARLRSPAGFTIVETLVACIVLLSGLLAVATLIDSSNSTTTVTRARVTATNIAREVVEAARGVSYEQISDGAILTEIQNSDTALRDAQPGAPYTIERRGVVYTITADTCILDDGRDGGGAAPRSGDYCADSVAAGSLDTRSGRTDRLPEDYKRVRVDVSWTFRGDARNITQTTFLNNPGSAGAPAIVSLATATLGNPPRQVRPGETSVDFTVTTSSTPKNVTWLLDGARAGLVCTNCSGKGPFGFTWNLDGGANPADDGPYLIAAEAYDSQNVAGPSRSLTVIVNRNQPIAPKGFAGGRQPDNTVELEWLPNPERDLTGYTVYRVNGSGNEVEVCALSLVTRCVDKVPPPDNSITYRVRAWDIDLNGAPRLNANANGYSEITALASNQPPADPENVTRTVNPDGTTLISWTRPSPADPDTGDTIAFYRIYRDGLAYANRYARADDDGTAGSFTDYDTSGHTYYVVAVDTNMRESGAVKAP